MRVHRPKTVCSAVQTSERLRDVSDMRRALVLGVQHAETHRLLGGMCLCHALLLLVSLAAQSWAQRFDAKAVFAACAEGVVGIRTPNASGSGFIVSRDGWLVTNRHVLRQPGLWSSGSVYGRSEITVKLKDGRTPVVLCVDTIPDFRELDLALLQIDCTPNVVLPLLPDSDARVGDEAVAIGHPVGLEWTQTKGSISNVDTGDYIQIDVAINPGNSGGPILNQRGQVLGMATAKVAVLELTGFALKVGRVRSVLKSRKIAYLTEPLVMAGLSPEERITTTLIQERELLNADRARLDSEKVEFARERQEFLNQKAASAELIAQAEPIRRRHEETEARLADLARRETELVNRTQQLENRLAASRHLYPRRLGLELLGTGDYLVGEGIAGRTYALGGSIALLYRFDINTTSAESEARRANRCGLSFSYRQIRVGPAAQRSPENRAEMALVLDLGQDFRIGLGAPFSLLRSPGAEQYVFMPLALYIASNPVPLALTGRVQSPLSLDQATGSVGIALGYGASFLRL